MNGELTKIRFYAQKVMPLVYDDSLSYVEVLYKVAYKLNDTIDKYNLLTDNVNALSGRVEQQQTQIDYLESQIDGFEKEITSLFEQLEIQINTEVDAKLNEVDEKLSTIDGRIDALENELRKQIADLQSYLINMINDQLVLFREELERNNKQLKYWVETELDNFIHSLPDVQNVLVVSPISGTIMNVQDALNELAEIFKVFYGITAFEYDSLKLTATQYDHYNVNGLRRGLTATEYDFFAKKYLKSDFGERVVNPVNGSNENFRNIINLNTDLHKASGSYTAEEYDLILISAGDYDNLNLTAFEYDWLSNSKIA